ncbi:MAG: biopolymer transporter ExbD [Candidatus Brocadiia bacterium]
MRRAKLQIEEGIAIDMTPIIDIIFQLLIFLMCVTEITKTENDQRLVLPYASKATPETEPTERVVINVFPKGKSGMLLYSLMLDTGARDASVTVEGNALTWGDLQKYLEIRGRSAKKTSGGVGVGNRELVDLPVKIRGHRTCPFQYVQFAMIYCIDMSYWKISFGTFNIDDFHLPAVTEDYGDQMNAGDLWNPPELNKLFQ